MITWPSFSLYCWYFFSSSLFSWRDIFLSNELFTLRIGFMTHLIPPTCLSTNLSNKTYFVMITVCVLWRIRGFTFILGDDSRILVATYHHRMLWLTSLLFGSVTQVFYLLDMVWCSSVPEI